LTDRPEVPFAANDVRLSPREWVIAVLLAAAILAVVPIAWEWIEPLEIQANHRVPFRLGGDYWTYSRSCRAACAEGNKTLVIGDSVVWGHYVGKDETLPAHLNDAMDAERFVNLGIDGIHPAALAGLVEQYGRAITGRKVILHCNLLWMSSERRDLRSTKEDPINHPDLIPQFVPSVPRYHAPISQRLSVVIGRKVPVFDFARHMQVTYLDGYDLPSWTIDNPYANPLENLGRELPSPDEPPSPRPDARPWTSRRDIRKIDPPWVELGKSLQWRCFRECVATLTGRGNRVFVLVGPFNEHMLTPEGLAKYAEPKARVRAWLRDNGIPHYIPRALPSDLYADASHPLGDGYATLAAELLKDEAFVRFAGRGEAAE